MSSPLYSRDILRLAASIPHYGRLAGPQASVEKNSPVCGSRVVVDLVADGEGRVAALGQEAAALLGNHAIGRSPEELAAARDALAAFLAGARDEPGDWPGLAVFREARSYPARHAAILLAFDAAAEAAARAAALAAAR